MEEDRQRRDESADAAAHWERLAEEADRFGEYEAVAVGSGSAWFAKAKTYRDAAKALRMEAETGVWHCSCCLSPNKLCGSRQVSC